MKVMRTLLITMLFAFGCGEITVVEGEPPADPSGLGTSGANCTKTADCEVGLQCLGGICVDPTKGGEGESCQGTNDCRQPLVCVENVCTSNGAQPPAGDCPVECQDLDCCTINGNDVNRASNVCSGCDSSAQCFDGAPGYVDPLECQLCLPECEHFACCDMRTQGWVPEAKCHGCEGGNACSPLEVGFLPESYCPCSDNIQFNLLQVLEEAGQTYCTTAGDQAQFRQMLPGGLASEFDCSQCFFQLLRCIEEQCDTECDGLCTPELFMTWSPCYECHAVEGSCMLQFRSCSGLSLSL